MHSSINFIIALILLTIGFYHLATFPNVLESFYMTLLIGVCNGVGGYQLGIGLAKALKGE